jgi:hypothetical protein
MIAAWLWDFERPSEVMPTAARMVHEIWVPSHFTADAVARATDRRVERLLLPIGVERGRPLRSRDEPTSSECVFMARVDYDTGFARQNPLGIAEAFRRAFSTEEGSRLVFETAHAERFPSEHARLVEAVAERGDIEVRGGITRRVPDASVAQASCFVSLHRSEGTGLALARAMSRGMPTIVTAHSFSAEMQGDGDSFQVPCTLTPIPSTAYRGEQGARWAEPDLDAAAAAMRVVAARAISASAKARRAQERARRQFSPSRSVRAITNRLRAIEQLRYGDVGQQSSLASQFSAAADRS